MSVVSLSSMIHPDANEREAEARCGVEQEVRVCLADVFGEEGRGRAEAVNPLSERVELDGDIRRGVRRRKKHCCEHRYRYQRLRREKPTTTIESTHCRTSPV